jgi:hypothetical protein
MMMRVRSDRWFAMVCDFLIPCDMKTCTYDAYMPSIRFGFAYFYSIAKRGTFLGENKIESFAFFRVSPRTDHYVVWTPIFWSD